MRLNQFIALATGISRRTADSLISEHKVKVNGVAATLGLIVQQNDQIIVNGKIIEAPDNTLAIILNKPVDYVCSRDGQGSKTVYDLLPTEYDKLKPVGRLDKDSSGLILLTNDGQLAHKLTHPSFAKEKVYEIELDKPLKPEHLAQIERGITLEDGLSKLKLNGKDNKWLITMSEGRNRQIRRTFGALDYKVTKLHRVKFGSYNLNSLASGKFAEIQI